MTLIVINASVAIFAFCLLSALVDTRIRKNCIESSIMMLGVLSAVAMLINQKFYSAAFACFAFSAAMLAVYMRIKIQKRGHI